MQLDPEREEKELVLAALGPEPGVFVEVGANHPHLGSQTHLLAQHGWKGILVEPQAALYATLVRERPDSVVVRAACTSPDRVGRLTLHIPCESGFATVSPNRDDFYVKYARTETVEARTLDDIVDEWRRIPGNSCRIRFVAIDVEGHELEVLRGFSVGRHQPDLILVEDKLQDLSKHRFLRSAGYRLVRRTCLNNWYLPVHSESLDRGWTERLRLNRKVFLGLPFRMLRRWRHRRRGSAP